MLFRSWCHMVKGEVAMRLLIWRQEMRAMLAEQSAILKSQLLAQGYHSGLKLLKSTVAYMLREDAGLCVATWRAAQQDDRMKMDIKLLQSELTERVTNTAKGAALRLLRLTLAYTVKGEVGLRIRRWKDKMTVQEASQTRVMTLQLEMELRRAAVREIAWVFTRVAVCEASARLDRWLFRARRGRSQVIALRQIQRVVHHALKGQVSLCVFTWSNNMHNSLSEESLNDAVLESAMRKLAAEKEAVAASADAEREAMEKETKRLLERYEIDQKRLKIEEKQERERQKVREPCDIRVRSDDD